MIMSIIRSVVKVLFLCLVLWKLISDVYMWERTISVNDFSSVHFWHLTQLFLCGETSGGDQGRFAWTLCCRVDLVLRWWQLWYGRDKMFCTNVLVLMFTVPCIDGSGVCMGTCNSASVWNGSTSTFYFQTEKVQLKPAVCLYILNM